MELEDLIQYLSLCLKGKATKEQQQEIMRWLAEDEEHRRTYQQACELFYKLNYASQWDKIDTRKAIKNTRKSLVRRPRWGYRLAGIAALILICLGVTLFIKTGNQIIPEPLNVAEEVKSGEMKAMLTLANGQKVELNSGNKVEVDLGFGRAVEDSLSGLVYQLKDTVTVPREFHTLSVPRAGEYVMVLSDGSKVWLNSETELKFPVKFDTDKREVFLTGEAYFEVVKDPVRPFIVSTPQTQTTVLGTSFNVMAYQDEAHTEITLVTGAVRVNAGTKQCQIVPGQQVAVGSGSFEVRQVNTAFYTSWKDGLFDFDNMTLNELCVKLSRWYDVEFFFMNQTVAEKRFTGAIKRSRSLQFMFDFIQKTSGVRFELKGKTVTVYNN